ncbi:MAG: hypothetical protein JO314_08735 [Acidobacteria bacterium]|nr:hypothetical protein [Acidobacteriota bacterium]
MKVKVIKKAELESLGEQSESIPAKPKRRRLKQAVEQWVEEIRAKTEAEEHVILESLLHPETGSSHS